MDEFTVSVNETIRAIATGGVDAESMLVCKGATHVLGAHSAEYVMYRVEVKYPKVPHEWAYYLHVPSIDAWYVNFSEDACWEDLTHSYIDDLKNHYIQYFATRLSSQNAEIMKRDEEIASLRESLTMTREAWDDASWDLVP